MKKAKRKPSRSLIEARKKHEKFLASFGISKQKRLNNPDNMPDLTVKQVAPLSNTIPSNGYKRSIDDHKWRRDVVETKEAIIETERKKSRVAPYTNKGAYMFITDADDAKVLGKKI